MAVQKVFESTFCTVAFCVVALTAQGAVINLTQTDVRTGGVGGTVYSGNTSILQGNLTDAGAGQTDVAVFSTQYVNAGAGTYTAFFRVQANGNDPTEQGYNSYPLTGNLPMDQKNGGPAGSTPETVAGPTNSTAVNDMSDYRVNYNGQEYYQFSLDTNEANDFDKRFISLDNIVLFSSSQTVDPEYASLADIYDDPDMVVRWEMDTEDKSVNNTVLLNSDLAQGGGRDNLLFLVPVSSFAGAAATDHVYFYTQFGLFNAGGTTEAVNAGTYQTVTFRVESTEEQWALLGIGVIPEPETVALVALGILGIFILRARNRRRESA